MKSKECVTAQVVNRNQQPQEYMTATEASEGGINRHYPDNSQTPATSEAGHMSQEFVEDPEFRVQLTDALAGAVHLHSIGHRHMF